MSAQTLNPNPPGRVCGTINGTFDQGQCIQISSSGEVSAGKNFDSTFGPLKFRLNSRNALYGWTIEVIPSTWTSDADPEYSWVVNPPYHFQNIRYFDTSYGIKAQDAVKLTPRDFNFVLDEKQYERASNLVDQAVSSHPFSDQRSQEELGKASEKAREELFSLPVGKGRLEIIDSRIDPAGGTDGLGAIKWVKFKIELHVPCDFAVANSASISIDRTKCSGAGK